MLIPMPPKDPDDIPAYLAKIIPLLQQALVNPEMDTLKVTVSHTVPPRLEEGVVAYADGTNWNPGSGAGLYVYVSGSWSKI